MSKRRKTTAPPKPNAQPAQRGKPVCAVIVLIVAAFLIFFRLGHYALWDDESNTALLAKGVLQTGDTCALVGHNIVAYGGGMTLNNLRDRVTPPFSSYLAAVFIGLLGDSAFVARLPFALFGFGTVGLLLWWLRRDRADLLTWVLLAMGILGNVSFLLYSRQCRYYGFAIFVCAALAYLYRHWSGRPRELAAFIAASLSLFACHYIIFLAFYVCLAVDYFVWGRREIRISWQQLAWIFATHLIVCGAIAYVWNPLATQYGGERPHNGLIEKSYLFWWNLRDADVCEFGVGFLILAAPVVYFLKRDSWLVRGPVAILAYIFAVVVFTPQRIDIHTSITADVRYLPPLIPLCTFVAVRTILAMTSGISWFALTLGALAFFTNLLHGGIFMQTGLRATITLYLQELMNPPSEPYSVVAKWINEHVERDATIWVQPDYMAYPLMYHAPNAIYGWQLDAPSKPQFANLDPIHFKFQKAPDYLIAFGPAVNDMSRALQSWKAPLQYSLVATLDQLGKDLYRPELMWRSFKPITGYDPRMWGIHIFKRTSPPYSASPTGGVGNAQAPADSASPAPAGK